MYKYKATVINVVDGDTFDPMVDLGFRIYHKVRIRLLEIDTPEMRGIEANRGKKCKEFAEKLLLNKEVLIQSEKEDSDLKTDSFGRWLCYLWIRDINIIDIYNQNCINKKYFTYNPEAIDSVEKL